MRKLTDIPSKAAQIRSQAIPVNVKADKVSPRRNGDSERNSTMSRYVRLESGLWWSLYWVTEQGTVFCQGKRNVARCALPRDEYHSILMYRDVLVYHHMSRNSRQRRRD